MNPVMYQAFVDELSKIAIELDMGFKPGEVVRPKLRAAATGIASKAENMAAYGAKKIPTGIGSTLSNMLKKGMAPPLLAGMRGPNPVMRAALGSSKAVAPVVTASKLPGGMMAGKSIAAAPPGIKGPTFNMQSAM